MSDKATVIYFSPTGGTQRCATLLAEKLAPAVQSVDIETVGDSFIADPAAVTVVAGPVYHGRIPAWMAERMQKLNGNGAPAVAMAVYGNRDYEDALRELCDLLTARGFRVVAGVAAIAQHSIVPSIGTGRPDGADEEQYADFAEKIQKKLAAGDTSAPVVPGNFPYRSPGDGGLTPLVSEACVGCGQCAQRCPAGAIDPADTTKTDPQKCILCMRCVVECPVQARALPKPVFERTEGFLQQVASKRRENELFFGFLA